LPPDVESVLEIGAGLGSVGALLGARFNYIGLEPDLVSQAEADRRTAGKVRRERIEDHVGMYDLICAFEVLEHLEDDVSALRLWRLHSRRWLLLSVPMNPARFGSSDEHAGHFRRYTVHGLTDVLSESGWKPRRILAYGFPAGYVLESVRNQLAARRLTPESMSGRTEASGRWLQPPPGISWLTWAVALPFRALQRPFCNSSLGTGTVVLAELAETTVLM
jgi:hypothetical protein